MEEAAQGAARHQVAADLGQHRLLLGGETKRQAAADALPHRGVGETRRDRRGGPVVAAADGQAPGLAEGEAPAARFRRGRGLGPGRLEEGAERGRQVGHPGGATQVLGQGVGDLVHLGQGGAEGGGQHHRRHSLDLGQARARPRRGGRLLRVEEPRREQAQPSLVEARTALQVDDGVAHHALAQPGAAEPQGLEGWMRFVVVHQVHSQDRAGPRRRPEAGAADPTAEANPVRERGLAGSGGGRTGGGQFRQPGAVEDDGGGLVAPGQAGQEEVAGGLGPEAPAQGEGPARADAGQPGQPGPRGGLRAGLGGHLPIIRGRRTSRNRPGAAVGSPGPEEGGKAGKNP